MGKQSIIVSLETAGRLQTELDQGDFYQIDTLIAEMSSGLGLDVLGMDTPLEDLSGGQRSKLILAKLLLEKPDVLILDEPTNRLDDEHVAWLSQFLQDFGGTFVVISHDRDFLNQITTHIADIEFGKLTKYTGNFNQSLETKGTVPRDLYETICGLKNVKSKKLKHIFANISFGSRSTMAKSRQKQLDKVERLTPPASAAKAIFDFPFAPMRDYSCC